MLASAHSLLALLALLLSAYGLGRPLLRGLRVGEDDGLSIATWSLTLGFTIASLLLAILGLLGWLHAPVLGIVTLAAMSWGAGELLKATRQWRRQTQPLAIATEGQPRVPTLVQQAMWLLAAIAVLAALVSALAPPTAGDAMCYHLQLPKHYLRVHSLEHLPLCENSTYPLLVEMLYLWGLAIEGGVTAQLIHWSWGLLLAGSTILLARPILGHPLAALAGALVLLVPGVTNQMAAPLNDVALAATCQLALVSWYRAMRGESQRYWILCGWMLGASLAIKYTALLLILAVGLVSLVRMLWHREAFKQALVGGAAAMVVASSVCGVWYLRAVWHWGNPVYPFFSSVFPTEDEDTDGLEPQGNELRRASKLPLAIHPLSVATAPWLLTFDPDQFGGSGHQLGAAFLALLPGLVLARRLRGLGVLLAICVLYFAQWYLLRQNVRFLLVITPTLALAAVWSMSEWSRWPRMLSRAAFALVLILFALQAGLPVYRARQHVAVACGFQSRDAYLQTHEPVWEIAQVVPAMLSEPTDHLLSQDFRAFYLDCRVTREVEYRRQSNYQESIAKPGELANQLTRAGFTHVLLAQPVGKGRRYNKTLLRLVWKARQTRPESLQTLATVYHEDEQGYRRRYDLIKLIPAQKSAASRTEKVHQHGDGRTHQDGQRKEAPEAEVAGVCVESCPSHDDNHAGDGIQQIEQAFCL